MKLSIREAATLLARSPRTIRGQIQRGDIPAEKKGRRWLIPSESLPLTEPQRRALQGKADEVRDLVEGALPSRVARTRGKRSRSIADVAAFRSARVVLLQMRAARGSGYAGLDAAITEVEAALLDLAEAEYHFGRDPKLKALASGRSHLGRAVGHLLVLDVLGPSGSLRQSAASVDLDVLGPSGSLRQSAASVGLNDELTEPVLAWVGTLENETASMLAGLVRWAERLPEQRR